MSVKRSTKPASKLRAAARAVLASAALMLSSGNAFATVFDFEETTALLDLSSSFDSESQNLSFEYALDTRNIEGGTGTDSFWLVVTPGEEPSMDRQDAVALVGDIETRRITALAYRKSDALVEFEEGETRDIPEAYRIATFDDAIAVTEVDGQQRVSFNIDATGINSARPDSETWTGAQFGETAGYWLRLAESSNFTYDESGALQEWGTGNVLRRDSALREVTDTCERQVSDGFEQVQTGTTTEEVCTAQPGTRVECAPVTRYRTVSESYSCPQQQCDTQHHWWLFFKPETTCRTVQRTCYRNVQRAYTEQQCRTVNVEDEVCETVVEPVYETVEQFRTETYECTRLERVDGEVVSAGGSSGADATDPDPTPSSGGSSSGGSSSGGGQVPAPGPLGLLALAGLLGVRRLRRKIG